MARAQNKGKMGCPFAPHLWVEDVDRERLFISNIFVLSYFAVCDFDREPPFDIFATNSGRLQKDATMFVKIFLFVSLASSAAFAQSKCEGLFVDRTLERRALRDVSLADIRAKEIAGKTAEEVAAMNAKTLLDLEAEIPFSENHRQKSQISMKTAEMLLQQIRENPVVKPGSSKYDQPGTSIGYCFGRATFVHMLLLKLGVQKKSIQKIFAVGPMKAGGITWQFHVATLTYVENIGWAVIDSNHIHPIPVKEWMEHYYSQALDGKVRFYATDASKFTFELGQYTRTQLGIGMSKERDWYKNYFKDMFDWLKTKRVTEDGVKTVNVRMTEEEKSIGNSFADMWRSVVEFVR